VCEKRAEMITNDEKIKAEKIIYIGRRHGIREKTT
jgi:hypothetical protein